MKTPAVEVTATAEVKAGVKTNRVRMKRPPLSERTVRVPLVAYHQEREVRGLGSTVVCISMPVSDLAALDQAAEELKMARSHLVRVAVREFIARQKGGQ